MSDDAKSSEIIQNKQIDKLTCIDVLENYLQIIFESIDNGRTICIETMLFRDEQTSENLCADTN